MTISFTDQVAIVTGAGRGLGRAYAHDLAARGANVVVNDLGGLDSAEGPWADQVVSEIVRDGGRAVANYDSVATAEGGQRIIDSAVAAFGTVDVVVNNAGFMRSKPLTDLSVADIESVIGVHLLAAFHVTRPAWSIMTAKNYGRVVFTSSSAALGNGGSSNYSAAKAGLFGLTASLALEGRPHGICVNAILPSAASEINSVNPNPTEEARRYRAMQDLLEGRRDPSLTAALVTYLASRECDVSGEIYSSIAGRYARVAFTIANGWLARDTSAVNAEMIAEHLDEIRNLADGVVPTCITDELEAVVSAVKASALVC